MEGSCSGSGNIGRAQPQKVKAWLPSQVGHAASESHSAGVASCCACASRWSCGYAGSVPHWSRSHIPHTSKLVCSSAWSARGPHTVQPYGWRTVLDGGGEDDGYWPGSLRGQTPLLLGYVQTLAPVQRQWSLHSAMSACCSGVCLTACGCLGFPLWW